MNILKGIIKDTYDAFSAIVNKKLTLSFVRSDKTKDKGCIYFGTQMYGIADIYSSDNSVSVNFDGKCGVDLTTEKPSTGIHWTYL